METLDQILSGNAGTPAADDQQQQHVVDDAGTQQPTTGESQTQTPPADGAGAAADATGATPATESSTMVPLKALEEERKGRQDWKEKAIRFEEELKHLRAQPPQSQGQQQQSQPVEMDFDMRLLNERLNTSEMLLRAKHDDVDDKLKVFQEAASKNPALGAELLQQRHPYEWMYKQAQRFQAMSEIGEDPAAYRERVRAELLAEIQQQGAATDHQPAAAAAQVAAKPAIPQSLATARSAAPRTAPVWTGPTSLNDILNRK
jgi:hypothetical protein